MSKRSRKNRRPRRSVFDSFAPPRQEKKPLWFGTPIDEPGGIDTVLIRAVPETPQEEQPVELSSPASQGDQYVKEFLDGLKEQPDLPPTSFGSKLFVAVLILAGLLLILYCAAGIYGWLG